jgi:Fe-S-cluster containining protein
MTSNTSERFEVAINTPAGQFTTGIEMPTGFVPVTAIVPLMRHLGEEAQALEVARTVESGKTVSCQKGCAACCRMLVPLSAPEALALHAWVHALPAEQQTKVSTRYDQSKSLLLAHGLWQPLSALCDASEPPEDQVVDELNRAYYALQMSCPFLEADVCQIYEERPAACRELLVTSPADQCQDVINNPIDPVAIPVRVSTILGLVWQELTKSHTRLIPLPVALDWAERHKAEQGLRWKGTQLLDLALDKVWRFLSQALPHDQSEDRK